MSKALSAQPWRLLGLSLLLILCVFGVWGWYHESPRWPELWQLFQGEGIDPIDQYILLHLRLPRILLAAMAGMMLSAAGLALQGLFRNPLMDPFILGVSGGGGLGAGVAILLGLNFSWWGLNPVTFFAFLCSLGVIAMVYRLGHFRGQLVLDRLLLGGVAMSALCSALLSLILVIKGQGLDQVVYWIMGSLNGRSWPDLITLIPFAVLGFPLLIYDLHALNILQTGEESAFSMGLNPRPLKIRMLLAASLLSASVVAVCGVIGFVGLMVPHIARLLMQTTDFRKLLLPSSLIGGMLLLGADALSRNLLAAQEVPVGILTSLLGVPFFLLLLHREAL